MLAQIVGFWALFNNLALGGLARGVPLHRQDVGDVLADLSVSRPVVHHGAR